MGPGATVTGTLAAVESDAPDEVEAVSEIDARLIEYSSPVCAAVTGERFPSAGAYAASMPPSVAALARRFARLDDVGYAAFLAALARARGDEAARAEGRVVVHGDGRRIRAHAPARHRPAALAARVDAAGVDAVATTRPAVADRLRDRGVPVVGPDAVARRLLYGADRETADRLAREHLDGPLDATPPRTLGARAREVGPVVGLVAVLVALVVVAGTGGPAPATADSTPAVNESEWVTAEPDGATTNETLAPGLTRAGVVDPAALAAAHEAALREGPYVVDLTYREQFRRERAFPRAGRYRTVEVAGATRYHETTTGWGDPTVAPIPTTEREVYADGARRFVRGPNGTVAELPLGPRGVDPHAVRGAEYVRRFLGIRQTDVVDTRVEDGEPVHRVAVRGTDREGVAAYSATALVTSEGLVRELRVSYLQYERDVGVSIYLRYDPGAGSVDPPSWYPENASTPNPTDDPRVGRYPD